MGVRNRFNPKSLRGAQARNICGLLFALLSRYQDPGVDGTRRQDMITERPTVTLGTNSLQTVIVDLGAQKGNRNHAGDLVSV